MSSIAGARIHEIKVRHHARKFGRSKYGLSRIYKVLFDLMSIKTIIAFAQRPMQGFGLMAAPFALLGVLFLALTVHVAGVDPDATLVVPAGLAMVCGATTGFLLVCGALAELIFKTGDVRPLDFSRLTAAEED
jgi:hypothetical protein